MRIEDEGVLSLTTRAIAAWVEGHADLLQGVVALRTLGPEADRAVEAVLAVRDLRVLRLSFELLELLARDSGVNARSLLRGVSSAPQVRSLDGAVFGVCASDDVGETG